MLLQNAFRLLGTSASLAAMLFSSASYAEEDDRIEINCIDSGGGIPSNIQNQLFSKLYTKKKKLKGQGLGLAICKEIMNSYNGDLVFNDSLDNTCFSLKIPNTK